MGERAEFLDLLVEMVLGTEPDGDWRDEAEGLPDEATLEELARFLGTEKDDGQAAARMLYVSITRARLACVVSYANSRFINGQAAWHTPSRYTAHLGTAFAGRTAGIPEGLAQRLVNAATNL